MKKQNFTVPLELRQLLEFDDNRRLSIEEDSYSQSPSGAIDDYGHFKTFWVDPFEFEAELKFYSSNSKSQSLLICDLPKEISDSIGYVSEKIMFLMFPTDLLSAIMDGAIISEGKIKGKFGFSKKGSRIGIKWLSN